jgi:hypothetical protein
MTIKTKTMMTALFVIIFMLAGCSAQAPQANMDNAASAAPSASAAPTASASAQPTQTDAPKDANWVIEIDDTQQITDEMGLIWNYQISMYASKAGGEDVLGSYTGEIVLNMEPDFDSAKALAAQEGAELLAMLFKHHSEAQNVTFEVVEYDQDTYAQLMKDSAPDNPLLQFDSPTSTADSLAITRVTFNATQEPIDMTVSDDNGTYSGTVPGRQVSVTVPMEITIEGADVYCYIYETVHPLSRAFKGVITGDVVS